MRHHPTRSFPKSPQFGTWLDSKTDGKQVPETAEEGQGVGLLSGSVQGTYQKAIHLLVKGILAGHASALGGIVGDKEKNQHGAPPPVVMVASSILEP
jgi:hypothetical protein